MKEIPPHSVILGIAWSHHSIEEFRRWADAVAYVMNIRLEDITGKTDSLPGKRDGDITAKEIMRRILILRLLTTY